MVTTSYRRTFTLRHAVLPVIHVRDADQALRNAHIAASAGCDGVFLINHGISTQSLLEIEAEVSSQMTDLWTGVNLLGTAPEDVFGKLAPGVGGVWTDNARIRENQESQPDAESIRHSRNNSGWSGLYFGGVAFKYQRSVEDLGAAARIASEFMDVVTTSGPGTGMAADLKKIETMKRSLEDSPLAIASGITPSNVDQFLPFADCLLVATGISASWDELDPALVADLLARVRNYRD